MADRRWCRANGKRDGRFINGRDFLFRDCFVLFCMSMKFLVTAELGRESRVVSLCFAFTRFWGIWGSGSKVIAFGMIPDR